MPIWVYLAALAVVASVPVAWWSLAGLPADTGRHRINLMPRSASRAPADLREVALQESARSRLLGPALADLERRGRRITPAGMAESLERKLRRAGLQGRWPLERVLGAKVVTAVLGVVLGLFFLAGNPSAAGALIAAALTAIGYFTPDVIVHGRAAERQKAIGLQLADTLDQITVSVEAGLGFEAALAQAGRSGTGPLAEELIRTLQDIQVGVPRSRALANLLDRTDVADLRHFVTAVKQAERYGVPIAQVLRVQSGELRDKRRQRAEEQAMKVPVKIVFPVVLCILPALFVVVAGPAALRLFDALA